MKDKFGRPYAKLHELSPGMNLRCDGGFTCMAEGEIKIVKKEKDELFVDCRDKSGRHYLFADDSSGAIVGFYIEGCK